MSALGTKAEGMAAAAREARRAVSALGTTPDSKAALENLAGWLEALAAAEERACAAEVAA